MAKKENENGNEQQQEQEQKTAARVQEPKIELDKRIILNALRRLGGEPLGGIR